MSIQTAQVGIDNIDDIAGIDSIITALTNIDGVTEVEIQPQQNTAYVRFDDTQTSIHALKAAISMVDYVTQPFPVDAPQHPDNL